jgi:hypothetical protein
VPRDSVFSTTTTDLPLADWDELLSLADTDANPLRFSRGQRALSVHWTRGGGFVQVGPRAVADDGTDVAVPGHWVDLDWSQCNRLIKFLRNARDQAFGQPE